MENISIQQLVLGAISIWFVIWLILDISVVCPVKDNREKQLKRIFCFFWPISITFAFWALLWNVSVALINSLLKWVDSKI